MSARLSRAPTLRSGFISRGSGSRRRGRCGSARARRDRAPASRGDAARGRRWCAAPGTPTRPRGPPGASSARRRVPGRRRHRPQQLELDVRQLHLPAVELYRPSSRCRSLRPFEGDQLVAVLALVRRQLRPPEERAHAAAELVDRKRLRDVVVGAELEPDHLVQLVVAGGEHDDRHRAAGAEPLADLEPIHVRQHDVEDDEIRVLGRKAIESLLTVEGGDDAETVAFERVPQKRWTASSSSTSRMVGGSDIRTPAARQVSNRRTYYSPACPQQRPRLGAVARGVARSSGRSAVARTAARGCSSPCRSFSPRSR